MKVTKSKKLLLYILYGCLVITCLFIAYYLVVISNLERHQFPDNKRFFREVKYEFQGKRSVIVQHSISVTNNKYYSKVDFSNGDKNGSITYSGKIKRNIFHNSFSYSVGKIKIDDEDFAISTFKELDSPLIDELISAYLSGEKFETFGFKVLLVSNDEKTICYQSVKYKIIRCMNSY
ncbi:hypothetical protein [Shewanella waksmanii]|uniref:hypothetical protein n=1 Tax=Shewanella waksmanii TaxID=213783 RepID=UPI00048B08C3|nr:hypothetical protein [Shewanella waksmanii]